MVSPWALLWCYYTHEIIKLIKFSSGSKGIEVVDSDSGI